MGIFHGRERPLYGSLGQTRGIPQVQKRGEGILKYVMGLIGRDLRPWGLPVGAHFRRLLLQLEGNSFRSLFADPRDGLDASRVAAG